MQDENGHVRWLRGQSGAYRKSAEGVEDEKRRKALLTTAERMLSAANALELALAGDAPDGMGGHTGLVKRLQRGTLVDVKLINGAGLRGMITAMGRYDFAIVDSDGHELVVPKHAVLYWEPRGEGEQGSGGEGEAGGEGAR